jgi:hypothetical protein
VPTGVNVTVLGVMVRDATGGSVTVIVAVAEIPSDVTVMVVEPAASAVTTPVALTAATVGAALAYVIVRPDNVFPAPSLVTGVMVTVAPTRSAAEVGVIVIVATGGGVTVIVEEPVAPPTVAVMVADPVATAVTRPALLTVAMPGALLLHTAVGTGEQFCAVGVDVNVEDDPTAIDTVAGDTLTALTEHDGCTGSPPAHAESTAASNRAVGVAARA